MFKTDDSANSAGPDMSNGALRSPQILICLNSSRNDADVESFYNYGTSMRE